jgi:hypothetical protein
VLAGLITHLVLPQVAEALRAAGLSDPKAFLRQTLGGDRGGQSEVERHLRRQFVGQVLEPVGLACCTPMSVSPPRWARCSAPRIGEVLAAEPQPASPRAIAFFETAGAAGRRAGFAIADVEVAADARRVEAVIQADARPVLADLCEVVCTASTATWLLLSGRPSRLRAVTTSCWPSLPVPPHRIIGMHRYAVGGWYPFRDANARIEDPKTTAAVGAMLCALAEGRLESFLMRTSRLRCVHGALHRPHGDLRPDPRAATCCCRRSTSRTSVRTARRRFTMTFAAPTFLGFRQLPIERWPASPLYALEFANPDSVPRWRCRCA